MNDVGQRLFTVFIDIVHTETLCQQHIDLDGDQRILLAVHIVVLDIQLGAVESGLVNADLILHIQIIQNLAHDALGLLPLLSRTLILVVGVGGIPLGEAEGALIQHTHGAQEVLGQLQTALELLLQLIGTQHQMALGNGELADADQAVHLAGILVAEQGGGLAQTHGQVAVGPLAVQVDLILERAGHGTHGKTFLGFIIRIAQNEHAVQIVVPVAGDLIQVALGHQGRLSQQVAGLLLHIFHPTLQQLHYASTLGQQDGQTLSDGIHGGKILQIAAQLVMVALQRFLTLLEILVQLVLLGEGHGVDTLQHLAVAVAAPVGAAALGQLDAVALDAAGRIQMGAGAQIHKLALTVEADHSVGGQIIDQLHLIRLFLLLHELNSLLAGQLEALQLQLLLADLAHFRFQRGNVLLRKVERGVKVIVEAAVDTGADGQLHFRVQTLDSLRQHMGTGMPIGLAVVLVFKGVQVFFRHMQILL